MKYLIAFDTTIIRQNQAPEWSVDTVLTWGTDIAENLSSLPQDNEALTFYVPTVLNYTNSLSYDGANLALRILMHYIRTGRTDVAVVLLGNETESSFLLHYDYPNILKIPGVDYVRFNKKIVASHTPSHPLLSKTDEYIPYLDDLGLKIPSSFKSTHSLTNEWCLYKWNSFMGFNENTSSLEGNLYFEYLITIEKLNKVRNKVASEHLKDRIRNFPASRILLIDDKEGWHSFFKNLFSVSTNVELHCLGEEFNKMEFEDIEKKIDAEINNFKPDVVLLDFRLMEDRDADIRDNMKQVSGYKVLSGLLKGTFQAPNNSYGRQVLIFTATSRIENIMLLRNGNADGFIFKEKPGNYNGKEITRDIISKMLSTLETAVGRAQFLIPLNSKLKNLDNILAVSNPELRERILTVSESVRLITQTNDLNEGILKLCYLNLFSILESLKPSDIKQIDRYVQDNAPNAILRYWNNIDKLRNSLAHGDKKVKINGREKEISVSLIKEWMIILCDFVNEFINNSVIIDN